jgi:hypothetical protein
MRVLNAVLAVLACSSGCHEPARLGRPVVVRALDEEGAPLSALAVEVDGLPAVRTDTQGRAQLSLAAQGPARARVTVRCPEGSREPSPRHVARVVEGGAARLELAFVCRPAQRVIAVVVRAPGAVGSVLRADGEPIGTVAEDGTLHATVLRPPDSELQLMLDTGTLPVGPAKALREHRVADHDELLVFDQPPPPPAHRAPRSPPKRVGRVGSDDSPFGGRR